MNNIKSIRISKENGESSVIDIDSLRNGSIEISDGYVSIEERYPNVYQGVFIFMHNHWEFFFGIGLAAAFLWAFSMFS